MLPPTCGESAGFSLGTEMRTTVMQPHPKTTAFQYRLSRLLQMKKKKAVNKYPGTTVNLKWVTGPLLVYAGCCWSNPYDKSQRAKHTRASKPSSNSGHAPSVAPPTSVVLDHGSPNSIFAVAACRGHAAVHTDVCVDLSSPSAVPRG